MRKKFWTVFGQYMRPIAGADGEKVNWLNYKTGTRHIYFRMDADNNFASIAIELRHRDHDLRRHYFEKLQELKPLLEQTTNLNWNWQPEQADEDGNKISRISDKIEGVNVFRETDWPAIISFLKPGIIALDEFWMLAKDIINNKAGR